MKAKSAAKKAPVKAARAAVKSARHASKSTPRGGKAAPAKAAKAPAAAAKGTKPGPAKPAPKFAAKAAPVPAKVAAAPKPTAVPAGKGLVAQATSTASKFASSLKRAILPTAPSNRPAARKAAAAATASAERMAASLAQAKGQPIPVSTKGGKGAKGGKGGSARARALAAGEDSCREVACESLATTGGYCRLHYIKNWRMIKRKESILGEGKLTQYIEELVSKYPDKYIEAILLDLADETAFAKVVLDLELDESVEEFAEGEGGDEAAEGTIDSLRREIEPEDAEGGF